MTARKASAKKTAAHKAAGGADPAQRKRPDFAAITADAERRALAAGSIVYVADDISTQLVSSPQLEEPVPALRVDWVDWESGFRDSGLRPGDLLVAVDGTRVERPASPEAAQKTVYKMVGQYGEPQAWAEAGRKEGDRLTLTVRRRAGGHGWEELDVTGELRGRRTWTDVNGRRLVGPMGPDQMADDGFGGAWTGWYEEVVRAWTPLIDPWSLLSGSSLYELGVHEEREKRVRALEKGYPGPFSAAAVADWEDIRDRLEGRPVTLDDDALEFRRRGEERVEDIRGAGRAARTAFLGAHGKELIPAFPSIDPVFGDKGKVDGRLTELPAVGNAQWIGQGNGTIFVFSRSDQYYFALGESPAVVAMLEARGRYEQRVTSSLGAAFAMIGRVKAETALMVVEGQAVWGLMVDPAAATLGDEALFVDLTGVGSAPLPPFAGEELLASGSASVPPGGAAPEAVLAASFDALKLGEQDVWRMLYADWYVWFADTGRPVVNIGGVYSFDSNWELGRSMILGDVVDVRVRWVDDVVPLVKGDEFEGAPKIDQVLVDIEHLRQEDGRSARSFTKVGLNRTWVLQRLNGGPWRITSNQGI